MRAPSLSKKLVVTGHEFAVTQNPNTSLDRLFCQVEAIRKDISKKNSTKPNTSKP